MPKGEPMNRILFALALLLLPVQAQAQSTFVKPPGALTTIVPNYNVTVGVWVAVTGAGGCLCVFEQQPNGTWILSGSGGAEYADFNFALNEPALGPTAWINQNGLPGANITLAYRFPSITAPAPADAYSQTNSALGAAFQIIISPSKNVPAVVGK